MLLHGPLDDLSAARTSAELMTLDAEGDEPVTLRVDCGEGSLALGLTLMDVIELLGVPVHALCLGQVGAGAVGVVAVCARRVAMPSTRFALREPTTEQSPVHVRNVAQWSKLRTDERERFCARVAEAARRPVAQVREDLDGGQVPRRAGRRRLRADRRGVAPGRGDQPSSRRRNPADGVPSTILRHRH